MPAIIAPSRCLHCSIILRFRNGPGQSQLAWDFSHLVLPDLMGVLEREAERKLLFAYAQLAQEGEWNAKQHHLMRDVTILVRDTGMRHKKELFAVRIEDIDWNHRTIFIPDSKTPTGRRFVPMSDRAVDLLMVRCAGRREGWLFEAQNQVGPLDHS
jgi:integrase